MPASPTNMWNCTSGARKTFPTKRRAIKLLLMIPLSTALLSLNCQPTRICPLFLPVTVRSAGRVIKRPEPRSKRDISIFIGCVAAFLSGKPTDIPWSELTFRRASSRNQEHHVQTEYSQNEIVESRDARHCSPAPPGYCKHL